MRLVKPIRWAVLLAGVILCATVAFPADKAGQRARAMAAFDQAQQMHDALESQPDGSRHKEEFRKVITAYFDVYRADPSYYKTPGALAAIAELYQEMGQQFATDSYYLESIKSYRFLAKQYPGIRISRDALYTVGVVYRQDLEDPDDARKAFQEYIQAYPKSEKVAQAQEILKQLDQQVAEKAPVPTPVPASAHREVLPVEKIQDIRSTAESPASKVEAASTVRQVTAVRRWVGPNYLRIVVEVGGDTTFESVRLSNPDRIVVDVQNSQLSSDLMGKVFPVEDGFLRQIRVAQFAPRVSRVVLDVEKIESYSVFSLPNPFRLVIDVEGETTPLVATTAKPAPAPAGERIAGNVHVSTPPVNPPPVTPLGAPAKFPSATATRVKTATSIAPPPVSPDKYTTVTTAPASGLSKRTTDQTETTTASIAPPIQPALPTEAGSRTLTRALGLKIGRIVIDPGHGGHDTGTIGPTGLEEKDVVLDVGLKLKKLLEVNTGCEVIMTRSDDTFIPLEERTAIANEKAADLFISIHANASPDPSARGIETYYLNFTSNSDALEVAARENASSQEAVHQLQDLIKKIAMTEKIEESQDFARLVQHEVYTRVSKVSAQQDRGIKKAPFIVLIGANMPSILDEISFLSNPRDERLLRRSDYREKIAYALYEGILDYLKNLGEVRSVQRVASDQTSPAVGPDF